MTFAQAALVIVSVAAVTLGLACYHLLTRLDALEQAVSGGLQPPSRRLARDEFEQRFARATARAAVARQIGHGVVLVVGSEFPGSELERSLAHLQRGDGLVLASDANAPTDSSAVDRLELPGLSRIALDTAALGVGVTPYVFVIDDEQIRVARPLASAADLAETLRAFT